MHNMITTLSVADKMPIFNPFQSKSKGGQPKKRTSNKEEMSYKSNDEDLLAHLENLQLEVSRLHHQLASIQSQQCQVRVKEEVSTQKSHQTFSTIGTTQPNHSSASNPRYVVSSLYIRFHYNAWLGQGKHSLTLSPSIFLANQTQYQTSTLSTIP